MSGEKKKLKVVAMDSGELAARWDISNRLVGEGRWRNKGVSKFNRVAEILGVLFSPEKHIVGMAIIHSPEELLGMVNACLPIDERVCSRTFRRYLSGESVGRWADSDLVDMFKVSYELALYEQKQRLFQLLAEDQPGGWQRWTWILERRFDDWNLRNKVVNETPDMKRLLLKKQGA